MSQLTQAPAAVYQQQEYVIRRQVFKLFGGGFHIYDAAGGLIGYSKQKAFKLKEDIRVYADQACTDEMLVILARQIVDFSASYDVFDSRVGQVVGTLRRKGWSSLFRDEWVMSDGEGREVARLKEDSLLMALIRRYLSNIIPQKFHASTAAGVEVATYKQNFNPFVQKLKVSINPAGAADVDPRLLLAGGILLAAIEGRQRN